jgi:hypothetical protein
LLTASRERELPEEDTSAAGVLMRLTAMSDQIQILVGALLSSVEFVYDYVQLRFDGPCLTVNAPFEIHVGETAFKQNEVGYRDALCERIGKSVRAAYTVPERHIGIDFDDQSSIHISLRPRDQVGPEAAVLECKSFPTCVW